MTLPTCTPRPVVVMGVSGSGKTSVARALALGWNRPFLEGDDYHPASNLRKMANGIPLTQADRVPWLARLCEELELQRHQGLTPVVACSALSRATRAQLRRSWPQLLFVHLVAPRSVIAGRLRSRTGHFMPAHLLDSQLEALQPPSQDALTIDAVEPVAVLVERIAAAVLELERGRRGCKSG